MRFVLYVPLFFFLFFVYINILRSECVVCRGVSVRAGVCCETQCYVVEQKDQLVDTPKQHCFLVFSIV